MNRKIIVVTGYLASGKSTFARLLSKEIKVPCFVKDTFKIALCKNISISTAEDSSLFSAITFDSMMYVIERFMETDLPVIIEGNFVPTGIKKVDEANEIKLLIDKYGIQSLTFKFIGNTHILHKRYIERDKQPERGHVNAMYSDVKYEDFNKYCHNLDAFDIGGETIIIDTTDFDNIDFIGYVEIAKKFVK